MPSSVCVVSRYKVINSTLLAHSHLIGELPEEKHGSHMKSLRGKILLGVQSRADRGSMDSIQPVGIPHRVGLLMPALCSTQLCRITREIMTDVYEGKVRLGLKHRKR